MYYCYGSQQTLKSPGSSARNSISGSSSSTDTEPTNSAPPAARNRYKQTAVVPARPRAGSDSTSTKGPVSKMMDLFRHRSQSAVSAEDKRKAVSFIIYIILYKIIIQKYQYVYIDQPI